MLHLKDSVYDTLKWLVIIVFPACATLYSALASVWGWPFAEQVTTTITAVDTFFGAVLCISTVSYHKEDKNNGASK